MTTAVVTVVHGRHEHLRHQEEHLSRLPAHARVVVAMDDPEVARIVRPDAQVVDVPLHAGRLPLARARNAGVRHALDRGADLVVLLDVDCLPGADLLGRYEDAAGRVGPALLCGPVTYLPEGSGAPDDLAAWTSPHPARPAPADGDLLRDGDHRLFWSLSFAVTPATWLRLGGFCEEYDGYGGEDTDLGFTARERGLELVWVGGAHAYHQHHPVSSPPVEHVDDILRNAAVFHRRWGEWPMEGWLNAFADRGLVRFDGSTWLRT